jgi:hypothetical protein
MANKDSNKKGNYPQSKYSIELCEAICNEIATTEKGLHAILKRPEYPSVGMFMRWLSCGKYPELVEMYTRAKESQAEFMANQIISIADDSSSDELITEDGRVIENREFVNRSRLRVDTRKWLMAKLYPRKYGDKIDVTSDGKQIMQTVIVPDKMAADNLNKLEP